MGYRSLSEMFLARVTATPDKVAFQYPSGAGYASVTWLETQARARAIACGLAALGIKHEERCAILSGTRLEWVLADLGIMCAGAATTTIYPANTPDECAFIINDSDSRVVFAENSDQVKKLTAQRSALSKVAKVIVFDGQADAGGWVMPLSELESLGREHDKKDRAAFDKSARSVEAKHLATLIYTSGTTGRPKGVELTHDCWVSVAEGIAAVDLLRQDDLQYFWLPLAHSFGKVLESAQLLLGFTTVVDGRIDKLVENLAKVRPTFMAAAPRIFEKVHSKVVAGMRAAGGIKAKLFDWAMQVGHEVSRRKRAGQSIGLLLRLRHVVADRLVLSKLRARFGGRLRFFVSGSAPLALEISEFFHAAGILILEGYGLTESSAASFVNLPNSFAFGTVGKPFPGLEVRIASDGEVLMRGRGIMRGYHGLPEATAEAKDREGWLHTGDIGELDSAGRLRITDRKKDLIKTSGGKYVAPQALEGKLKAVSPYVSQVVVHGDRRNFITALITLDEETIKPWLTERGLAGLSPEQRAKDPQVLALINEAFTQLNGTLARYETIKKFAILPHEFSVETGELTASLKVKRKAVEARYKDLLDGFYAGAAMKEAG